MTASRCDCGAGCTRPSKSMRLSRDLAKAATGFEAVVGRTPKGFCCPVCLREMNPMCATIAHAPARSVGGRPVVFLCRDCNSSLGSQLEAAAATFSDWAHQDKTGKRVVKARFGKADGPSAYFRATLSNEDIGRHAIRLEELGPVPDYVRDRLAPDGERRSLQLHEPSPEHARLAFVSWAYLVLFAKFGYSYVLTAAADLVRMDLADGRASRLGLGVTVNRGRDTFPVPHGEVVLVSTAPFGPSPRFTLVGLGAQFDATLVTLPLAFDSTADRVRTIQTLAADDGSLQAHVVGIPLADLYAEAAASNYLDSVCRLVYGEGGRTLTLVGTTAQDSAAQLRAARPLSKWTSPRRVRPKPTKEWRRGLTDLPARLAIEDWSSWVAEDVAWRLTASGASDDLIGLVKQLCLSSTPIQLGSSLKGLVPAHVSAHVDDARRVLLEGARPREVDPMGAANAISQLRLLRAKLGLQASINTEVFAEVIEEGSYAGVHALRMVVDDRQLVVGPYYSFRTLLLAVRFILPPWMEGAPAVSPSIGES